MPDDNRTRTLDEINRCHELMTVEHDPLRIATIACLLSYLERELARTKAPDQTEHSGRLAAAH